MPRWTANRQVIQHFVGYTPHILYWTNAYVVKKWHNNILENVLKQIKIYLKMSITILKTDKSPHFNHWKSKLRFLRVFTLLFAITSHAEENDFGPPIALCLNKHTIPYINTTSPAESIVNDAYKACNGAVDEWNKERASLPREMVIKQNKEFRDMYIRMIEIRRKQIQKISR